MLLADLRVGKATVFMCFQKMKGYEESEPVQLKCKGVTGNFDLSIMLQAL